MKTLTTDIGDTFDVRTSFGDVIIDAYDTETDANAGFALYPREARRLARMLLKAADEVEND